MDHLLNGSHPFLCISTASSRTSALRSEDKERTCVRQLALPQIVADFAERQRQQRAQTVNDIAGTLIPG